MIANRRKRMSNQAQGVSIDDMVAEGMNGLMIAIDHYNPSTGNKFSTPAAWWIEQPIRNFLDAKTKTIHMPTHMNNIYKSMHYAVRALREIYPDDSAITDEAISAYCKSTGRDISVEKIKEARDLRRETISYDVPVGDSDGTEKDLVNFMESDENIADDVTEELGGSDNFNRMLAFISDDKKREILRDWYNAKDMHDLVILSNISRKHCLTKERVRALKIEAEEELREKILALAEKNGVSVYDAIMVEEDMPDNYKPYHNPQSIYAH
jgi:RNA polymerase sigma factor (sigma-70 family)